MALELLKPTPNVKQGTDTRPVVQNGPHIDFGQAIGSWRMTTDWEAFGEALDAIATDSATRARLQKRLASAEGKRAGRIRAGLHNVDMLGYERMARRFSARTETINRLTAQIAAYEQEFANAKVDPERAAKLLAPLTDPLKRRRASLLGWQTRDTNRLDVTMFLTDAEAKQRAKALNVDATSNHIGARHVAHLTADIQRVDKRIQESKTRIGALQMPYDKSVYEKLDGKSGVPYGTRTGDRIHTSYYLLATRVETPAAAEALAREIGKELATHGDYTQFNDELRGMINRFARQFGNEHAERRIRNAAVEGFLLRLKHGIGGNAAIPAYDAGLTRITDAQMDNVFDFMGKIAAFQYAVRNPDTVIKPVADIRQRIERYRKMKDHPLVRSHIARLENELKRIDPNAVNHAFFDLMNAPLLHDPLVGGSGSLRDRQQLVFSIPGLGIEEIATAAGFATFSGARRDSSIVGILRNTMLSQASPEAKESPEFAALVAHIKSMPAIQTASPKDVTRSSARSHESTGYHQPKAKRKALRKKIFSREQTFGEFQKEIAGAKKRENAWLNKPQAPRNERPSFSDVWVGDVLHRTAELALHGDKKIKARLSAVLARAGSDTVNTGELISDVAALFKHVYDKLPWWKQGKGYYPKVDDYMFRGMASHWVTEAKLKGVEHLQTMTDQSPDALRETLNPARFNLTQRGMQGAIEENRKKFDTPKPRKSLLDWFRGN